MLVSKASLGVASIAVTGKAISGLGYVCVERDGAVVAASGSVVAAVGPIGASVAKSVPLAGGEDGFAPGEQVVMTADAARTLARAMPRDTLFRGLLEIASLRRGATAEVTAEVTDGKARSSVKINRVAPRWSVAWRAIVRRILGVEERARVLVNRRDLEAAIDAMRAACTYSGEFEAVEFSFRVDGSLVLRAHNVLTDQRVVIVFQGAANVESPARTPWEESLVRIVAAKKRGAA